MKTPWKAVGALNIGLAHFLWQDIMARKY